MRSLDLNILIAASFFAVAIDDLNDVQANTNILSQKYSFTHSKRRKSENSEMM